ncbi:MAG: Fmu (Sun) domain-containing protein, partial [Ferruginibacter sp.]
MQRFNSYISEATKLIEDYKGKVPFSVYTKAYFSQNKKFGSTDRRTINNFCYYFFRVGHAVSGPINDVIIAGIFLCENEESSILEHFNPAFNNSITKSTLDKLKILNIEPESIFPYSSYISKDID